MLLELNAFMSDSDASHISSLSKKERRGKRDYGKLLEPDMKKMRLSSSPDEDRGQPEFTIANIMADLANITNWRELGLQLELSSARLDLIQSESDEPKVKMITVWKDLDPDACWEKLVRALASPAMCENRVAKGIAERRGSSFDKKSALELQSLGSSFSEFEILDFTEANVRNAIVNVKHTRALGEHLKIPPSILDDIDKHPIEQRKEKLVAAWFKVDPDCKWKTLWAAMSAIKVTEWSARKSMSGSFSEDILSPSSNGTGGNIAEIAEEELHAPSFASKKNDKMIKSEYFKLKLSITKNLEKVGVDMDDFRQCVQDIFDTGDSIAEADSINSIFKTLTNRKHWNFLDVSGLESIVDIFSGHFEAENMKLIDAYKARLAGYKAATKIKDYIAFNKENDGESMECGTVEEYISVTENRDKYDEKYRTKLSVKLLGNEMASVKISLQSLAYIEKLWNSLCKEFNMPSLPHLLDRIVDGCVVVHWIVHHDHVWKLLEGITSGMEFFEREFIAYVQLDEVRVYDQETGVNLKILGYVRLLLVAQEGKRDETQAILQECFPDIDVPIDEAERTALMCAAQHGHQVLMEPLLDHGADMYLYDRNRETILSLSEPHDDLHEWLQNRFEDKLITAARDNELTLVKRSLEIGVDSNAKEKDEYAWTALLWACEKGHRGVVEYLLEHGADTNVEDKANWTGLILSSRRGYLEIVRKLLDKGAKVNQLTNVRWSSLLWTAQEGHTEVARLLLERGADPKIPDKNGFTPLIQASQDGHLGVVKLLVEQISIAELDVKTNTDWSAIMVATKNGHEDIVQYLTKKFDIHYSNTDEVTALHIASFKGHNSIVRYMCITAKMDVNVQENDGVTPLMFAAKQGDLKVVKTLVENGHANVNIFENDSGWTAAFFAMEGIENHDLEVLEYLLRSGRVDISHKDKKGNTIVDIARSMHSKALDILSKYNKAETEKMISQSQRKAPVNMKDYKQLIEAMKNKMAAQPRKTVVAGAA